MPDPSQGSSSSRQAGGSGLGAADPDLGLLSGPGARRGIWKRVVARLAWPVLRRQIELNHLLVERLGELRGLVEAELDRLGHEQLDALALELHDALATERARIEDLAGTVERHSWAIEAALPVLERHGYQIDGASAAIDEHGKVLGRHGAAIDSALPVLERHGYELEGLGSRLGRLSELAEQHGRRIEAATEAAERHAKVLDRHGAAFDSALPVLERHGWDLKALEESLEGLRELVERREREAFARHHDGIGLLRTELGDLAQDLEVRLGELAGELASRAEALSAEDERLARRVASGELELEATREQTERRLAEMRIGLARADLVTEELRRALAGSASAGGPAASPPGGARAEALRDRAPAGGQAEGAYDRLYGAFEEAVHDPGRAAEERARAYLADIVALGSGRPVLDIGAGRGAWLEVLRKAGVDAYGVEPDPGHLEPERSVELDIRSVDPFEHLRGVEEGGLRAITVVRLVERLPADRIVELIDLAARALEGGGLLVLEAPNPDNLLVGASELYVDPRVARPVPARLLAFLAGARGFTDVEVRPVDGAGRPKLAEPGGDEPWAAVLRPVVEVLNERLFGAPFFAVLARRP